MKIIVDPIYKNLCPICHGDVFASLLENTGTCRKCINGESSSALNAVSFYKSLTEEELYFNEFFKKATNGLKPWGAQKTWIKRLINGENTVIIAPTGMGKTTLLIVYAVYMAKEYHKKVLFLAPTKALAKQIFTRLVSAVENVCGDCINVLYYDSSTSKKKREKLLDNIRNLRYDVLVLTNNFLIRNKDLITEKHVDLIIIDDVDSLLRSSKNIIKLLKLLGYEDKVIELAKRRNSILWKIVVSKSLNKEEELRKYIEELIEIESEIEGFLSAKKHKQVVIASATGRMRGAYAKVMRDLLRIDVSGVTIYGRNVTDSYMFIESEDHDKVISIIKRLGSGGLILISPRHPFKHEFQRILDKIIEKLGHEYRIAEAKPKTIKEFIEGKYDLIYGSSSYYGVSVRGIDAPETIRYVIFLGTPMFTIELKSFLASPSILARTSLLLAELYQDNEYRAISNKIRALVFKLSSGEVRILSMLLKEKLSQDDLDSEKLGRIYSELKVFYEKIYEDLRRVLKEKEVVEMNTVTFLYNKDKKKFLALIPDTMTYIQASGRSSRLYLGRMTHGLSIIIEKHTLKNLVNSMSKKLGFFTKQLEFKKIFEVDLEKELALIEKTRNELYTGTKLKYRNILVAVESPTKAKTIAKFFGKPSRRKIGSISIYEIPFVKGNEVIHLNIMATKGHIFDLTTDPDVPNHGISINGETISPVYSTIKKCKICGYQFTYGNRCPRCNSTSFYDSIEVVNVLRKLAQEADEVYIATDPDIEGEKIAYDVYLVIRGFVEKIWRIELHEITITVFLNALKNRRNINKNLVFAEIYRRSLDRLIGFSLSQDLWRKFSKRWLGAGRVQTPVLGWIISRYNEYKENMCRKIVIKLDEPLPTKINICIDKSDKETLKEIKNIKEVEVIVTKTYIDTVNPSPPYTTDELLLDASKKGLPSSLTMKIAQELFESGLITYHRTSSHYVSSTGISIARKYLEGKELVKYFKPSHWGEKGAHEAIRPVYPLDRLDLEKAITEGLVSATVPLTWLHFRVYELIFNRFIASQMKPYKILKARIIARITDQVKVELELPARIIEDGFNLVSSVKIYPVLETSNRLIVTVKDIRSLISSKVPLYNEGTIIKKMREEKLGRPSTYATILASILRHGYAIRSKKRSYLIPTKSGIMVYNYLYENYKDLVSVNTTRELELYVESIASGKLDVGEAIMNAINKISSYALPLSIKEVTTTNLEEEMTKASSI